MAKKKEKPRRDLGAGSLYQKTYMRGGRMLKEETWTIQFYCDGRRVREATGLRNRSEAQKVLTARLYKVARGEYIKTQTRAALVEELWKVLDAHLRADGRKDAADRLAWQWREHLAPEFGLQRAARVSTADIAAYTAKRREKGAAPATINRELGALRRMFRLGAEATPPMVERVPRIHMLTENNVRTGFVEQADFEKLSAGAHDLWLKTFLELGFTYGWRRGELLGLRMKNVDLLGRKIRLEVGSTKNGEGREVALTTRATELLRACCIGKRPNDAVFTRGEKNEPVRDVRDAWAALCVEVGLGRWVCSNSKCEGEIVGMRCKECKRTKRYTGLTPHDLRRSAAKNARRKGIPESVIMKLGGWKTAAMFRRYAIVSEADQLAAVAALEQPSAPIAPQPRAPEQPTLKLQ
jgi:integrase